MKIYAAQIPDDSMTFIKRIEGKDLWIRAFYIKLSQKSHSL